MDSLIEVGGVGYAPNVHIDGDSILFHEPAFLVCKIRVDPELVLLCQSHGDRPHRGTRIGRMKELWPFESLKRYLLEQTKEFFRQMRSRGNDPLQSETEMEVWGPFQEKADISNTRLINIEEGNPFFPDGRWVADNRGTIRLESKGPQQMTRDKVLNSLNWERGAVFLVRGRFIATQGYREESTGVVLV